jgi:hypothetical protein
MSKLHFRYLLTSALVTGIAAVACQIFISTLLIPEKQEGLTGAAFIAGWWGNLAAAFAMAISAARKATKDLIDPRLGRIAGIGMGVWVGAGAFAGNTAAAMLLASRDSAAVRPGLVILFGLISFGVALITSMIAGRESAQPPEEEEA